MGNVAHLLNKAAGREMIASQDHPLALSSGIHRGAAARREPRAARTGSFRDVQTCTRLAVLSEPSHFHRGVFCVMMRKHRSLFIPHHKY